jgi:hypothetical protein
MDEAKSLVDECIRTGSTKLDLSNLNLTVLPELPDTLTRLYCENNQLTVLPELPDTLTYLKCENNQLTVLPELPDTLTYLSCRNNQLTVLPLKLLRNDCYVFSDNNKQLYENTSKSIISRALTTRRWNRYYRQWIVAKSIDNLFDSDTASVIASYC